MIYWLTDEHAIALTEAYWAAIAELLVAQQRRRSALMEALLTGAPRPRRPAGQAAVLLFSPPSITPRA